MNKKLLTTILIASIAITGLFAKSYTPSTGSSAILEAKKNSDPYTFIIQYNNSGSTDSATLGALILDDTEKETPEAFTIETSADGNESNSITFTTTVTTGQFVEAVVGSNATDETGNYPVLLDDSANITLMSHSEEVTYVVGIAGSFLDASTGSYVVTFGPGKHKEGSEVARFKLLYKGNDEMVAGDYRSTSTIEITSDEV